MDIYDAKTKAQKSDEESLSRRRVYVLSGYLLLLVAVILTTVLILTRYKSGSPTVSDEPTHPPPSEPQPAGYPIDPPSPGPTMLVRVTKGSQPPPTDTTHVYIDGNE